jgi:cytochrome b pre-mRNA-processing protein 3
VSTRSRAKREELDTLLRLGVLPGKSRHQRTPAALYAAAVSAARDPYFYASLGVADTLDGRFDLVALYTFLLVNRLQDAADPGPALAQGVFDAMFKDMDSNLREIGVGDLSVGKRVRAMWEAFHGRSKAYAEAVHAADPEALAAALTRNVWRGSAPEGAARKLAALALLQVADLAAQSLDSLASGQVQFRPARDIAA